MKSSGLTARKLRLLLILTMVLVSVLAAVGFYFMQMQLRAYANEISQLNADALDGGENLNTLRQLSVQLDEKASTIAKTKRIVAESKQYVYQDEIIKDLATIGRESGVSVTGFSFTGAGVVAGTSTTPTGTTAPESSPTPAASSNPSTLKSQSVTVTIASPVAYTNLMRFIKRIELNPLKMQIARVSISKESGSKVTSDSFVIEVYVR